MFKSGEKPNKFEKNKFNKRRTGNSSFRSINNYQLSDKIPNDNLYKNDNYYSINKNFEFQEAEEKSFRLFYHHHYRKNSIKGLLILLYLRFCVAQVNYLMDIFSFWKIFNKKNLFHIFSLIISLLLTKDENLKQNKVNFFLFYFFVFNQCMHIYNIYSKMDTKYEEFFILSSELFFNCSLFMFLSADTKELFFPQIIIQSVFFYSINKYKSINVILYGIPGMAFIFFIFVILKKSVRERWALFDSFKRSYYNMSQGLLEKDPNPIFILSKDKNILYRNNSAVKLINNILDNQPPPKRMGRGNKDDRFNSINISEIIHPNLRELFKKILTDFMENDNLNTFNFPICKSKLQKDLHLDVCNIYDISDENIYLNLVWFRMIIFKTEWKGKSSFYLCFLPCDHILLNEIFYKYTKRLTEKMEKMINNIDIICDALINKNENEENINESKSSSINSDNNKNLGSEDDEQDVEEEEGVEDKEEKIKFKKGVHELLIENSSNKELNDTILFFFKNQVELLYDYSLTCELYFNMIYKMRNFKWDIETPKKNLKKCIKLKELKSYYLEYFYDFIKEHDYKLEFKDDTENNYNIYIEENYLRVILFNIIIFMICYIDSKEEKSSKENNKEIIIKLIPEIKEETSITPDSKINNDDADKLTPKISSDSDKNLKKGEVTFIFESFSTKADLNKIHELINQKNKKNKNMSHIKSEILMLNYLDIGILTVNFILENYYKTKLDMSNNEGDQIIKFKLPCELELINSSSNSKSYLYNINSESNSFFTSPLYISKQNINKPKNFYNYNQNYNKKVMNMFYGIKKSPMISPTRHIRGVPSFSHIKEINKNRAFERHLSQKNVTMDIQNIKTNINIDEIKNQNNLKNEVKDINKYSFKQVDFYFDSANGNNINITKTENETNEIIKKESKAESKEDEEKNKVLIFKSQRNKELITLLNNENKGEYSLKIMDDVSEKEKEMKIKGNCGKQVVLINMGILNEIKFAEKICENKGKTLIYGYHFGAHTKCKEKNNAKFDKRFDLSFSSEGIVFTLKHIFNNNTSIIK